MADTGLFWTNTVLPPGLTPRVGPFPGWGQGTGIAQDGGMWSLCSGDPSPSCGGGVPLGRLHRRVGLSPAGDTLGKEAGDQPALPSSPHSFNSCDGGPGGDGQTLSGERVRRFRRGRERDGGRCKEGNKDR